MLGVRNPSIVMMVGVSGINIANAVSQITRLTHMRTRVNFDRGGRFLPSRAPGKIAVSSASRMHSMICQTPPGTLVGE